MIFRLKWFEMDDDHWLSGYIRIQPFIMEHDTLISDVLKREGQREPRIDWVRFWGLATARWFPFVFLNLLPWQGAICNSFCNDESRAWHKLFQGWYSMTTCFVERCFHTPNVPQEILFWIQMYTVGYAFLFHKRLASPGFRVCFANLPPCPPANSIPSQKPRWPFQKVLTEEAFTAANVRDLIWCPCSGCNGWTSPVLTVGFLQWDVYQTDVR